MTKRDGHTEWYVWAAATAVTFAALETRAVASRGERATLSHVMRWHVRRNTVTKVAGAAFAAWFAYHILWERLS